MRRIWAQSRNKSAYAGVLWLCICFVGDGKGASAPCLAYEPQIVKLTGTLISKTYPGPPEYASIRAGDEPETYWLVALPQPICVARDDSQPYTYGSQKNVRRVQLVFRNVTIYRTHRKLLGRQVVATGTLYEANTIHHKTPVLLWVHTLAATEAGTGRR
jgi:Domain of unknown function (DUF4431)